MILSACLYLEWKMLEGGRFHWKILFDIFYFFVDNENPMNHMPIDVKSCSPNEEVPIGDVFNLHVFIKSLIINNNLFYWTYVLLLIFYRVRMRIDQKMERVLTTTQSTLIKKLLMSNPSHFQICGEILHLLTKLFYHLFNQVHWIEF